MTSAEPARVEPQATQSFGGRARTGTVWLVTGFGLGQLLRLVGNIVLAHILFEEAFALMAIVTAVMMGLAMFSDIGLQPSVVQNPRGEDPDFVNTAWTLQVIRGIGLFLVALALAWPLSHFYGANDPEAYQLLYLIPIVALTALLDGFQSPAVMTAARHLKIKEVTKIELIVGPFQVSVMLLLAWHMRSVYALALAFVLATALHTVLTYCMLDKVRPRWRWHPGSVKAIISFGKWVFVSTVFSFLASQLDRLALARMFDLAEVGVYSIAASLAIIVPTLVGKLQWTVLFPWYSRMLDEGMPLEVAFARTRTAMMVMSSLLCTALVAGATSFFSLAYDQRYAMGGALLPVLAFGAWFSCLETMYGATFIASGRPKWSALSNACKVITYACLLAIAAWLKLDILVAAVFLSVSELTRWLVCHLLGRSIGLRNARPEIGVFAYFVGTSLAGWWLVAHAPYVSSLPPFWRLAMLAVAIALMYAPLVWRFVVPLVLRR